MDWYIIRDPNEYGDVATVWNWRRGEWCWDVDGEYTAADGFAYCDKGTAQRRAKQVQETNWANMHRYNRAEWTPTKNVRVIDRAELEHIRTQG